MSFDDDAYGALTDHDDDARWAYGTGFADPLAGVPTAVPGDVDRADLAAYCLMLGDDALIMSHRLQQWVTRAPELEDELALANIALDLLGQARLLLARAGEAEARDGTRTRWPTCATREFATCGWPSGGCRLRPPRRPAAGLLVLAAAAARPADRVARPGARGDRREGGQGGHLPPEYAAQVGGPARRRHRPLAPADAAAIDAVLPTGRRALRDARGGGAPRGGGGGS
jgi:hypothetical protein